MNLEKFNLDIEVQNRLEAYVSLLGKWRAITNLISDDGYADIWDRHIVDAICLQQTQPLARRWVDIGSGAGIPGVIIACLLSGDQKTQVHCVEIDRRKCAFLREVTTSLSLPLKIHNVRAENLNPLHFPDIEIVTARAFSSLKHILDVARPFLNLQAIAVLPRGRQGPDEVAQLNDPDYIMATIRNPSPGGGIFVTIKRPVSRNP